MPTNPLQTANNAIPGFDNLSSSASSIIGNLLNGLPSPDEARLDNAYFGAGTGLDPTSPFLVNRGRGLYGQRGEQRQQQGIEDLLKLLGTYSGTVMPTTGEQQRAHEFSYNANLNLQDRNRALQDQNREFQEGRMGDWEQRGFNTAAKGSQNWLAGPNSAPSFIQQQYPQFMNWARMAPTKQR